MLHFIILKDKIWLRWILLAASCFEIRNPKLVKFKSQMYFDFMFIAFPVTTPIKYSIVRSAFAHEKRVEN